MKIEWQKYLFFYLRYHYVCFVDGTANMALDLFEFCVRFTPYFEQNINVTILE